MTRLQDTSPLVYRTILSAVVAYFLVLGYGVFADDPLAFLVGNALFGLIAIAVGGALYAESSRQLDPITVASTCLVMGGATQLLWLVTSIPELDLLASITVFVGVALYIYGIYA